MSGAGPTAAARALAWPAGVALLLAFGPVAPAQAEWLSRTVAGTMGTRIVV